MTYAKRSHSDAAAIPPALRLLVMSAQIPRLGRDGSWSLYHRLADLATRHDVTLGCLFDGDEDADALRCLERLGIRVIPTLRRSYPSIGNVHHGLPAHLAHEYGHPRMVDAVREIVRETPHDLLQVEYAEMAHMLFRALRRPAVYTCHEAQSLACRRLVEASPRWSCRRGLLRLELARNLLHERRFTRAFDRVVTLSTEDEAFLRTLVPEACITSIPIRVDTNYFRPAPEVESSCTVLFVGFFGHPPNVDGAEWLALHVFPAVRRRVASAELLLVGRPTQRIAALGAVPGVRVLGYVEDLREVLGRAAVVATPIRQGAGLRGKVLEAWASGKAVVTTSRAAEGFHVEHGREALVADDAPRFAEQLIACLENPGLRARIGEAGRERACRDFSIAGAPARRYEQVYAEVLRERGAE